jgi:hypothetical protein
MAQFSSPTFYSGYREQPVVRWTALDSGAVVPTHFGN